MALGKKNIQDQKKDQDRTAIQLHFYIQDVDPSAAASDIYALDSEFTTEAYANGFNALFGADLQNPRHLGIRFLDQAGLPVYQDRTNPQACQPYQQAYPDGVLFVHRGGCTFLTKLVNARAASAAGVVVMSLDNAPLNPTADDDELEAAGDLDDVALVYLTREMGKNVSDMLDAAEKYEDQQVILVIASEAELAASEQKKHPTSTDTDRILYVNGLPLLNTRLLI
jgi:mannosidase alpha-like ER degradation enhancer 1